MIFAVIGSVDGHVSHLRSALDAIENEGILNILHTGHAAWGPGGSEALALLQERGVQCVQGPRDRILARLERKRARMVKELGEAFPAFEASLAALRSADVEWLGKLPQERRLVFDEVPVLLCHGVPGDPHETFDSATSDQRLRRVREVAEASIVASGGAPAMFSCEVGGCLIMNAPALASERGALWARVDTDYGAMSAKPVVTPLET